MISSKLKFNSFIIFRFKCFTPNEVIIVDAGSTDNSIGIIKDFSNLLNIKDKLKTKYSVFIFPKNQRKNQLNY